MPKTDKQCSSVHYLPCDVSKTPLSSEDYATIMRPFWKQRKALQRVEVCNSPKQHPCMCECANCPYYRHERIVDIDELIINGEEPVSDTNIEQEVEQRIFEEQLLLSLTKMDPIDQIIIERIVLSDEKATERDVAKKIFQKLGRIISHQAIHKRIPQAAKRIAELMGYEF